MYVCTLRADVLASSSFGFDIQLECNCAALPRLVKSERKYSQISRNDSAGLFSFFSFSFSFFSGTSLVPLLLRRRAPCSAQRPSTVGSGQGDLGSAFAFKSQFPIFTLPRRRPHTQRDPCGPHWQSLESFFLFLRGRAKPYCIGPERVAVVASTLCTVVP